MTNAPRTAPVAGRGTATAAGVLLLAAAAVGPVDLVMASLLRAHARYGRVYRGLPAAIADKVDGSVVRYAVPAAAGYGALLGLGMLLLVPLAVLVWRRWPPVRLVAWLVVAALAAGQLGAVAVAIGVRQFVTTVVGQSCPSGLVGTVRAAVLPDWYLPVCCAAAAGALVLLAAGAVLLAGTRQGW